MNYSRQFKGKVEAALVCDVPGSLVSTAKDKILVHMAGIAGDRHYGFTFPSNGRYQMYPRRTEIRNSRQFSIISAEEMSEVAAQLNIAHIQPEWLGANILTSGIPAITFLPPSTRLTFPGGVALVVLGENEPCVNVGRVFKEELPDLIKHEADFVKAAVHKRGIVAWIEHPGTISPGDEITVEIPELVDYTQFLAR
jgi:hypothetical protein